MSLRGDFRLPATADFFAARRKLAGILSARVAGTGLLSRSAPAFFFVAALLGSVLPLLCRLSISPDDLAGRRVSFVYASNILGSVLGSLGIGFVLMNYLGLRQVALLLGGISVCGGVLVLLVRGPKDNPGASLGFCVGGPLRDRCSAGIAELRLTVRAHHLPAQTRVDDRFRSRG